MVFKRISSLSQVLSFLISSFRLGYSVFVLKIDLGLSLKKKLYLDTFIYCREKQKQDYSLIMPNQNCTHGSLRNGKIQISKRCIGREKCGLGKVEVKDRGGKLWSV